LNGLCLGSAAAGEGVRFA